MRYDTAVEFVKRVSGGEYDPTTSTLTNAVYKSVIDMANVTEQTAATQKATIGEIRPKTLVLRLRERHGIRFDFIKIDGYDKKFVTIHELNASKGYSVQVGEQNG